MSALGIGARRWLAAAATVALVMCVACCMALALPGAAFATKGDPYHYTVTVRGGNQGTVGGGDAATYEVAYGQAFALDKAAVELSDGSKYYVKGFRLSGQDALHPESFTVTEDMDFVVAYGVRGEMVSYTLSFVEYGTGRTLAPSATYYGNVGDKPIAAYEYIEGYRPRYRNITGTLGAEGSNNWTFEYIALDDGTTAAGGGSAVVGGAATTSTTAGGGAATAGAAGAGAAGAAGEAATGGNAAGEAPTPEVGGVGALIPTAAPTPGSASTGNGATVVEAPETEEILDIDVPLANLSPLDEAPHAVLDSAEAALVGPAIVIFGAAAVAVGAAFLVARGIRSRRSAR